MASATASRKHTIKCESCGQDYETQRPNTKLCRVCRLYTDFLYLHGRTKKCIVCLEDFAPITLRDPVCGKCDPVSRAADTEGECSFCHEHTDKLIHEDITVCRSCSTDPGNRDTLIRSLGNKVQERKDA